MEAVSPIPLENLFSTSVRTFENANTPHCLSITCCCQDYKQLGAIAWLADASPPLRVRKNLASTFSCKGAIPSWQIEDIWMARNMTFPTLFLGQGETVLFCQRWRDPKRSRFSLLPGDYHCSGASDNARRFIFPFGVSGKRSQAMKREGILGASKNCARNACKTEDDGGGPAGDGTIKATR